MWPIAARTCDSPLVTGITAFVPQKHTSMTAALEHLKPHKMPSSAKIFGGFAIAPPV
jgi:hypothetical protein